MDMETRGAHSFLTKSFSKAPKAPMTKFRSASREVRGMEGSRLSDSTRWKKVEKSAGLSAKIDQD